ncbi:hypothetical protein [Nocardioides antri]|uniref:hypothetical protein n=1 Tax=Nocardioides antri TaxID=2607659 RepID=UPI00165EDAA4|nr:hypothetical protein [Nocardioides antri]
MAPRSLTPLLALAVLVLALSACEEDADPSAETVDGAPVKAIPADASVAWSTSIEDDWDATDAVAVGDMVLVATKWDLEEDSAVTGYDTEGQQWWQEGPGYGTIELTVLDDGTVQACDDLGGEILDPATGEVVREATAEECPEEFDGADTTADDVYEVDGSELVVYDDVEHSEERYRIGLRDSDAVAWGVQGGVVTYSEGTHEVRFYR